VTATDLLTKMVEHHIWLTGEMISSVGRLSSDQLDQPIELSVDDDRQTVRSLLIAHVLTFAAHRRTLVALVLKKAGAGDLGWGDPMRWIAEPR
jgi:hypothetical protein